MRKYIPLVLFIFSWPVLSADIHGRVVRVLDGDTIEVIDSLKAVRIRLVNIDAPEKKQDYGRWSTDMMKSLVAGKATTGTPAPGYSSGRGSEAGGYSVAQKPRCQKTAADDRRMAEYNRGCSAVTGTSWLTPSRCSVVQPRKREKASFPRSRRFCNKNR